MKSITKALLVLMAASAIGWAVAPQSAAQGAATQGVARYDVVVVATPITENTPKGGLLPEQKPRTWEAIKIDRYSGDTWIYAMGAWQPIPTKAVTP